MPNVTALPFTLERERVVFGAREYVTTTETVHGLLRLEGAWLAIQWRAHRTVERYGREMRVDDEVDAVREIVLPLADLAAATLRRRGRWWFSSYELELTAANLRAFEEIAGAAGLKLDHPAQLRLGIASRDRVAAAEFAADVALARAALASGEEQARLPRS